MALIREREEGAAKAEIDARPKPRSPRESLMQNIISRRRQEH